MKRQNNIRLLAPAIFWPAVADSFKKLAPWHVVKSPVMFVVEVGSALTAYLWFRDLVRGAKPGAPLWFTGTTTLWLWFTVVFANFSEAMAEGRGKAQAATLRKMRKEIEARRLGEDSREERVPASALRKGDRVVVEAGDLIPGDGTVVQGIASVDESAITGESAPVIRESGGDRSAVTGGTRVLSDRIVVEIVANPGETFLDRMIALVEGASRQKTPNEVALHILLVGLTIIFIFACTTLVPMAVYSGAAPAVTVIFALLVCLIPTTIGGLLPAIGIAGIDRLLRKNVLAKSGHAIEAAGDVDTLLLDKTGTITYGNRMAAELIPLRGVRIEELAQAVRLGSLADETPEGRSILKLLAEKYGVPEGQCDPSAVFIPFSANTRMSGCDLGGRQVRKGAIDAVSHHVEALGGQASAEANEIGAHIGDQGGTPLAVADGNRLLGIIHLKDTVKAGIRERFARFRAMGIRTVMVTGDNPRTAATIAREAGVDDYLAEATPERKMALIKEEQAKGKLVAMTGDGTNDAPALAQADVGVAMNSGTQAAREAGNMVDLDSDPTKLLEIVEVGKQLLMTRGALTTFSIANDVAKYFAILPAMFMGVFPEIAPLNVMHLGSPSSAILAAVIFNAVIIVLLIPLSLRGVTYRPVGAAALLRRSMLVYGLGGVVAPFAGIKLIDLGLVGLGLK
ncbi:MAG: potassium-transporting ATPase subunit KdpB [Myxococcales bacterium]